jgi:hypothetical protein
MEVPGAHVSNPVATVRRRSLRRCMSCDTTRPRIRRSDSSTDSRTAGAVWALPPSAESRGGRGLRRQMIRGPDLVSAAGCRHAYYGTCQPLPHSGDQYLRTAKPGAEDSIGFAALGSGYDGSLGKKEDARLAPRRWASSVGSAPCGYSNRLRPTPGSSRCALGATTRSSSIVIRRADHVCSLNAGVRDSPQSTTGGLPRSRR